MIAVMGATGKTGRPAVERLLRAGRRVRVIGRSADRLRAFVERGAEPVVGSATDAAVLAAAFSGADAVYAMVPPDYSAPDPRAHYARVGAAIEAAVRTAGVRRVVLLSSLGAELGAGTGPIAGLHDVEKRLETIGVDLRILRPGYFYDNILANIALIEHQGINGGAIAPDVRFPMTDTGDIGAVAAAELAEAALGGTSVRELLGPRDYSMRETTAILGRKIGKPDLPYVQFPDSDVVGALTQAGMSAGAAALLVEMSHALSEGRVRSLQGRTAETTMPTAFETFADRFAAAYRSA